MVLLMVVILFQLGARLRPMAGEYRAAAPSAVARLRRLSRNCGGGAKGRYSRWRNALGVTPVSLRNAAANDEGVS